MFSSFSSFLLSLQFFKKLDALYSTFAPIIRNLVIGVHKFGSHVIQKGLALFNLVKNFVIKRGMELKDFIG